jgi:hypothetical protein
MKPSYKNAPKNFVVLTLCMGMSSSVLAADGHGSGIFGLFKKKKKEQPVLRAIPIEQGRDAGFDNNPGGRPDPISVPWTQSTDKEWRPVVDGTIESMNQAIDAHFGGLEKTGIGSMFGPKSAYASMTPEEQKAYIAANKRPGTMPQAPSRTSCIDFVLARLRAGYAKAGKLDRFNELKKIVVDNHGDGLYLLKELEKDGWTMVYWNPDSKNPSTAIRTDADPQRNHRPESHKWSAATVKNQGLYMPGITNESGDRFEGIKIDRTVENFRPTNPYSTPANYQDLQKLYDAPLFVGIANGGYHVYMGSQGKVVESHSTRGPKDPTNIEVRDFATWGLKGDEGFGSGVVAVPPGSWGQ